MVKLKVKRVRTDNLEEVKQAEEYGKIVSTRSGNYELLLPTKLNGELLPLVGKDFDMAVVEEDYGLKITLTRKKTKEAK
jgi:hypothetical protein